MVRVKFVAESNGKFFNLKQSGATLVFLLNNFMDENAYLHIYVVAKRLFFLFWEFSHGKDLHKLITSCVPGTEESASNFVINIKFDLKSRSSIYMLLGVFIIFFSLSVNRFLNTKMQSFPLAKSQK